MSPRGIIAVLCVLVSFAAVQGAGAQATGSQASGAQDHVPVPYAPGEFPGWLDEAWRAEAILVGVFPLSLFVTLEVYDSYRYVINNFDTTYAPWPLGSGSAAKYSANETLWIAVSAVSLSVAVAGIDFLLGRLHDSIAGR